MTIIKDLKKSKITQIYIESIVSSTHEIDLL